MHKIASPQDLQAELRRLLAYTSSPRPSRAKIVAGLRKLAAATDFDLLRLPKSLASTLVRKLNSVAQGTAFDSWQVDYSGNDRKRGWLGLKSEDTSRIDIEITPDEDGREGDYALKVTGNLSAPLKINGAFRDILDRVYWTYGDADTIRATLTSKVPAIMIAALEAAIDAQRG